MADTRTEASPRARTIRVGVFRDVDAAQRAVQGLLAAGFKESQISVLCSDEAKEQKFERFRNPQENPGMADAAGGAVAGGLLGAGLGGLLAAGLVTGAGIVVLAAGASLAAGGAVAGSFIGAMQSRGEEGPLANYYDQALTAGDLLVAVQEDGPDRETALQSADRVFRDAGARPVPLNSDV
ncbi:MAG: hypothetical protein KF774_06880 [Planctomyces sp.]|nr:hypothetical protein [Planctomyces sp.]